MWVNTDVIYGVKQNVKLSLPQSFLDMKPQKQQTSEWENSKKVNLFTLDRLSG